MDDAPVTEPDGTDATGPASAQPVASASTPDAVERASPRHAGAASTPDAGERAPHDEGGSTRASPRHAGAASTPDAGELAPHDEGGSTRAPGEPSRPPSVAPPLAILAALGALVDLGVSRVALRLFDPEGDPHVPLQLARIGLFPRNFVAITGLVALVAAVVDVLRRPRFASLFVRLPVALFAGVLLPALALATVLPRHRVAPHVVLVGMVGGIALASLVSGASVARARGWARAVAACASSTALLSFVVVVIASVRAVWIAGMGGPSARLARQASELAWWLVPIGLAVGYVRLRGPRPRAHEHVVFALALAVGAALVALGEQHLHPHYGTIVYGAFRVAALPEALSWVYVATASLGVATGLAALTSSSSNARQLGAASLLWIAGAHAPRSPIQILEATLAFVLIARVVHTVALDAAASSSTRAPATSLGGTDAAR